MQFYIFFSLNCNLQFCTLLLKTIIEPLPILDAMKVVRPLFYVLVFIIIIFFAKKATSSIVGLRIGKKRPWCKDNEEARLNVLSQFQLIANAAHYVVVRSLAG
jgi:hypothetical protein